MNAKRAKILWKTTGTVSKHEFLLEQLRTCLVERYVDRTPSTGLMTWKVTRRNVWKGIANWEMKQLSSCTVSTPCLDDRLFKEEELETVGELSTVCSQIVLQGLFLASIGRPYILLSVDKLARAFTKWTTACDRLLARLISFSTTQVIF